ncbi:hypothetical protein [Sphingorhabdus sp.]|uniref:hypothetical protein n=1 Tax=Sphingorhabdus sp. TaxID=1902408 RepID=UPI0037CAD175
MLGILRNTPFSCSRVVYIMPEEFTVTVSSSLDTTYLRHGLHTMVIPIEPDLLAYIGQIIMHWGHFECTMDTLIREIHVGLKKTPPDNWDSKSFSQRKKLFRDITQAYCARVGWEDEIGEFAKICADAADLHWRRNIIAHGIYQPVAETKKYPQHWVAVGTRKKEPVNLRVDETTLKKLFYDLGHLNGHLMALLARKGASFSHLTLTLPDAQLLQDSPSGDLQFLPIRNGSS